MSISLFPCILVGIKLFCRHVEYKNNKDYYRGKVKSVYEKEPLFKDFVRNIPLSEMNFYENRNLSTLKKRFNFLVQTKHGLDMNENYDPFSTNGVSQIKQKSKLLSLDYYIGQGHKVNRDKLIFLIYKSTKLKSLWLAVSDQNTHTYILEYYQILSPKYYALILVIYTA